MWFKQITFYPIQTDTLPENMALLDKLNSQHFEPPTGLEWQRDGFVSPYAFSPEMAFFAEKTWLVALKKAERVLPASVIREFLNERVAEIAEHEGRSLSKKEKQILKENITDELLPRAFIRSSHIHAICDVQNQFLLVNQASGKKSEHFISRLREALGGLNARLPHTQKSPSSLMTHWLLSGKCDGDFELDRFCELKGSGNAAPTIKINQQDLTADEVKQHIKNGKVATQLGLVWREQIAFVLTENFTLKRIQYLDVLHDEAQQHGDDAASVAFASQLIASETLSMLLKELVAHLGGWVE